MRLLSATDDFSIGGLPYPGFPILLWDDMQSCVEANDFLRYYLLRGAIGSRKSWAPIGQALYDYFGFLQAHELRWDDVDRGEQKELVAAYRDYCLNTVKQRHATVINRLVYVCAFYAFAKRRKWIRNLPYFEEIRKVKRGSGFLAHIDASGGRQVVRDVMPRAPRREVEFLTMAQIQALLDATVNVHHRMLLRLALGTGLRKQELATFPRAYVFDPELANRKERNIRVVLDPFDGHGMKTKGGRSRVLFISSRLMTDLNHYAKHTRGLRSSMGSNPQKALFLNQDGEPFSNDGKALDRIVRDIGKKIGLSVWTHMLRHTYATQTLVALQRAGDRSRIEPLVFLQRQLGHASIQSTMIYLHLVNEIADEAVLAYDNELNEIADQLNEQAQDVHQNRYFDSTRRT